MNNEKEEDCTWIVVIACGVFVALVTIMVFAVIGIRAVAMMPSKVEEEGYRAGKHGFSFTFCPYLPGSEHEPSWKTWLDQWSYRS